MIRALVIDDQPPAREDLRELLTAHADVAIVGEAGTVNRARALLALDNYDVVFLDIALAQGEDGFDLLPAVRPGARVIFVTAFNEHAVRAFEVNALYYLLKPVVPARLADAIGRLTAPGPSESDEMPAGLALRPEDTVYLRTGLKARFARVTEICLITANDNYTDVRLADGSKLFLRKSLKAWEETLPASHFMRVHRTQIVNLARVTRYQRDGDEHTLLYVEGATDPIPASRYRWSDLRERLSAIRPTR